MIDRTGSSRGHDRQKQTHRYTDYPCRYNFAGRARNNRFHVRTRHFAMGRGRDASGVLHIPFLLFQIRFKRRVSRDATGDSVFPQSNCIDPDRTGRSHLRWRLVRGQRDSPCATDRGERQIYRGHDSRRRHVSAGTCYEPDSGNQGKGAVGAW